MRKNFLDFTPDIQIIFATHFANLFRLNQNEVLDFLKKGNYEFENSDLGWNLSEKGNKEFADHFNIFGKKTEP